MFRKCWLAVIPLLLVGVTEASSQGDPACDDCYLFATHTYHDSMDEDLDSDFCVGLYTDLMEVCDENCLVVE